LVLFFKKEHSSFLRKSGTNLATSILREKLATKKFFVVPGIQDMITAVIADRVGFDVVYGTGYWLTASAYGLPDAGIATYTQMVDRMATLARTTKAAVIADADTGYGGLLNVHHTVRGYEQAGISAIQIEDQEFPKKCGHTPYKRLVSQQDMADKIRVAAEARHDPQNTLIIARTDARQSEGLDGALKRAEAYRNAGPAAVEGFRKVMVELIDEKDRKRFPGRPERPPMRR